MLSQYERICERCRSLVKVHLLYNLKHLSMRERERMCDSCMQYDSN